MRAVRLIDLARLACLLGAVGGWGCAAPIVGEWTAPGTSGHDNRMTVGSDDTGKATIYYFLADDPGRTTHLDRFEIEWSEVSDDRFDLTMSCYDSDVAGSPCPDQSFVMSCNASGLTSSSQAGALDCSGDANWDGYTFSWKAVTED
jgi:hypothetical protein